MNGYSIDFTVLIEELSLTGNQPIDVMLENKIRWKTVDDNKMSSGVSSHEHN